MPRLDRIWEARLKPLQPSELQQPFSKMQTHPAMEATYGLGDRSCAMKRNRDALTAIACVRSNDTRQT